jgi:hypothetical protein
LTLDYREAPWHGEPKVYYSRTPVLTERDLEDPDPLRLSREIAEVSRRVTLFRRRLAAGHIEGDPFFVGRIVTGKRAFDAVRSLDATDPLRRSLERWVYRLAEGRINQASILEVARERHQTEHVISEPERAKMTLSRVLTKVLGEPPRRKAWFASYVRASDGLGSAVAKLWERRAEVASRMGVDHPDAIESPGAMVVRDAQAWLGRTSDVYVEVSGKPDRFFEVALGAGANEGWPRHISPMVLSGLFHETDLLRGLDLDPGDLPPALAPASFLRALARVGAAWVDATAPDDQPFVIAHDPYGLRRRTVGSLFGLLPAQRSFAGRALGVDASRLAEHRRALWGVVLLESRALALRAILRRSALQGARMFRETFEARVADAFHLNVPPLAAGSLWTPRADTEQRFAGLLLAAGEAVRLRNAHDEDWYRNPRASEDLRDEARRSPEPETSQDALARGAEALLAEITDAVR